MMLRLDPPIPLWTPKGMGLAHFVTDYGVETNLIWTVFLETGAIWSFQNPEVLATTNETVGRHVNPVEDKSSEEDFLEWNRFPNKWPPSHLEYCKVVVQSDICNEVHIAKLDCPYGFHRDHAIVFNFKDKQFTYVKGQPNSLGFDQIIYWREIL